MLKALAILALLLAICVANIPDSLAKPATYEGANLDAASAVLERYRAPQISAETVNRLLEWIDAEKRGRDTEEVVIRLHDLQTEWRAASTRMDRELREVIEQAGKDSVYRAWAGFFRFVATAADLAARVKAYNAKQNSGSDAPSDGPGAADHRLSPRPQPGEGDVMVERSGKEEVYRGEGGEWRKVGIEEFIQRQIYFAPETGGSPGGADGGADGSAGSVRQGMGDTATAFLRTLRREAGVEPHCSDEWQGCVLVKEGGDDSWQPPEVMGEILGGKLGRPPTEAERVLYQAISGIVTPAEAGSLAADFTPVVGEAKSFLELVTGRDPVTGEDTSRMLALVGIIPVAGSKIKAGLKIAKISRKLLKTHHNIGNKYGDVFVVLKGEDLLKLRKVEVGEYANLKVDIIGKGKKEFENGYAHITTTSGAKGIVKKGEIIGEYPDGSRKVYMLRSNSGALSKSQLDAAEMIGKKGKKRQKGAAKAIIVTEKPGNRLIKEEKLKSGAVQYVFDGSVKLKEGTVIMMRK